MFRKSRDATFFGENGIFGNFADMRVITLDPGRFNDACNRLEHLVTASGFEPDLVVGISSGGEYVAEVMYHAKEHTTVTCRRPGTAGKQRHSKTLGLLKRLPRPLLNGMRITEALVLKRRKPASVTPHIEEPDKVAKARCILLVDDAIDSGLTMQTVVQALSGINKDADIRTAVITVTTAHPLIRPQYTLFDNRTLIRFPWSIDNR